MEIFSDIDFKSLVFGAAIAAAFVILGSMYNEFLYAFASIGFLYVGYNAPNMKTSLILGAFASTPIMYLAFEYNVFRGIPLNQEARIMMIIAILLVGMLVALIGAWAKRDRIKAKEEYEKQQKIGKNKKKKKNKKSEEK